MIEAQGSLRSITRRITRRVGGDFFFFFLDEVGVERDRDLVCGDPRRRENWDGAESSESESEATYRDAEEEA